MVCSRERRSQCWGRTKRHLKNAFERNALCVTTGFPAWTQSYAKVKQLGWVADLKACYEAGSNELRSLLAVGEENMTKHIRYSCKISLVSVAFAFFFSTELLAQTVPPGPDISPPTPLKQSFLAMSGAGQPIQDITLEGSVDCIAGSTHESGKITLKAAQGGFTSMTFSLPSGVHKEVRSQSSGQRAGAWFDGTTTRNYPWQTLLIEPYWFAPEIFMSAVSNEKRWVVANSTNGSSGGRQWLHLSINTNSPPGLPAPRDIVKFTTQDVVLYQDNWMPKTISYRQYEPSQRFRPTDIWFQYDDFRVVEGHMMPFHIQRYINATLNLDVRIQTVSLNTNLHPADFTLQ